MAHKTINKILYCFEFQFEYRIHYVGIDLYYKNQNFAFISSAKPCKFLFLPESTRPRFIIYRDKLTELYGLSRC